MLLLLFLAIVVILFVFCSKNGANKQSATIPSLNKKHNGNVTPQKSRKIKTGHFDNALDLKKEIIRWLVDQEINIVDCAEGKFSTRKLYGFSRVSAHIDDSVPLEDISKNKPHDLISISCNYRPRKDKEESIRNLLHFPSEIKIGDKSFNVPPPAPEIQIEIDCDYICDCHELLEISGNDAIINIDKKIEICCPFIVDSSPMLEEGVIEKTSLRRIDFSYKWFSYYTPPVQKIKYALATGDVRELMEIIKTACREIDGELLKIGYEAFFID